MPTDFDLSGWRKLDIPQFVNEVGPIYSYKNEDGSLSYALPTEPRHANVLGVVHGGVTATLLDQAMAMVAWRAADRRPTLTVQMDTRFLGAVQVGEVLVANATIRAMTGSLVFMEAELTVGDRVVADANAVMKISNGGDNRK